MKKLLKCEHQDCGKRIILKRDVERHQNTLKNPLCAADTRSHKQLLKNDNIHHHGANTKYKYDSRHQTFAASSQLKKHQQRHVTNK